MEVSGTRFEFSDRTYFYGQRKPNVLATRLDKIFATLGSVADASVDRALAGALATAEHPSAQRIATHLLERGHAESMVALIERFDQLSDELRTRVVGRVRDLYATLRKAANRATGPCSIHTLQIIREAREGRLAYLVAEQLRHRPTGVQQLAGDCLLDLATHATTAAADEDGSVRYPCDAETTRYIRVAVEEAVGLYAHHQQPSVLEAVLHLIPRPMPEALTQLAQADHAGVVVLRRHLSAASTPVVRRAVLGLIRIPTLTPSALEGLVRVCQEDQFSDVLTNWHLLLDPRVARPLSMTRHASRLWPRGSDWSRWPDHASRGLARWARCVGLDSADRVEKLAQLRHLPDPMARLSALRALIALATGHESIGANEAISRFCHDGDSRLARIALQHLIRVDWHGLPGLLPQLVNTADPRVGRLAGQRLAAKGFKDLWDHWSAIPTSKRLTMARALVKIDPRFMDRLARKLGRLDRPSRLRAISMIHQLDQAPLFVARLLEAAGDGDEVVASSAVKALGSSRSDAVRNALTSALRHGTAGCGPTRSRRCRPTRRRRTCVDSWRWRSTKTPGRGLMRWGVTGTGSRRSDEITGTDARRPPAGSAGQRVVGRAGVGVNRVGPARGGSVDLRRRSKSTGPRQPGGGPAHGPHERAGRR